MKKHSKTAKYLSLIARIIILVVAIFWFIFAILSGAQEYGGGITGILKNSPNALPWLILFVFVYVSWKWELVGGSLIALMGIFTIFAFDSYENLLSFLLISLPLIILGAMFVTSWFLKKRK